MPVALATGLSILRLRVVVRPILRKTAIGCCDMTLAGGLTITTPAAVDGGSFVVKIIAGGYNVVVNAAGASMIDGVQPSWSFDSGIDLLGRPAQDFISDGTNWYLD